MITPIVKPFHSRQSERGSVLLVALFIASMFGMFLASYLYLARGQKTNVTRSQAWNGALCAAEAGVEEALAQLNPGAPVPTVDRTANGWGPLSGGFYGPVSRSLSAGSYSVVYNNDPFPTIYSTGYVAVPSIPATLTRTVCVMTTNAPFFSTAMAAINTIDFKGNGVTTDSFNSSDPNLSTNGRYDPTKTSTNGDVASVSGIVNVGNGNVNGEVLLGPVGTDAIGSNGAVTGGTRNDFNVNFADVVVPQATWLPTAPLATPQVIDGVSYDYVFTQSNGDFSLFKPSGNIYVGTNANITLLINGNASPSAIRVAGMGSNAGKLTIYMNGPSFTLSGASSVDGSVASSLAYYGTTNNTQVSFTGNAAFTGTIYAPEAAIKLGGGGNNTYDFVGSLVGNTVTVNGHFNFHFDEALLTTGPQFLTARSWQEL
jgi:hypothetical protein